MHRRMAGCQSVASARRPFYLAIRERGVRIHRPRGTSAVGRGLFVDAKGVPARPSTLLDCRGQRLPATGSMFLAFGCRARPETFGRESATAIGGFKAWMCPPRGDAHRAHRERVAGPPPAHWRSIERAQAYERFPGPLREGPRGGGAGRMTSSPMGRTTDRMTVGRMRIPVSGESKRPLPKAGRGLQRSIRLLSGSLQDVRCAQLNVTRKPATMRSTSSMLSSDICRKPA